MKAAITIDEGGQQGRVIPLPETVFLIGRDPQCHLRPHCPSVSKLHCAIAAWAGVVRVRDLKSRNGTLLNGKLIDGEAVVRDGDHLKVGTLGFTFKITNDDGLPMTAPINERELQWLLETPSDADILSSATPTRIIPAECDPATAGQPGAPVRKRRSKVVSAGKHLRDYFSMRKHPTSQAECSNRD
jgi:predicted component of type VI protein secretion system